MPEEPNGDGWVGLPLLKIENLIDLTSNEKEEMVVEGARRAIWGWGVSLCDISRSFLVIQMRGSLRENVEFSYFSCMAPTPI